MDDNSPGNTYEVAKKYADIAIEKGEGRTIYRNIDRDA